MMFLRALLSWFVADDGNPFYNFTVMVTEPVILPVRALLERFEFVRGLPVDVSFFVTFILLTVAEYLLPAVSL